MAEELVLVTGAAGRVAGQLLPGLADRPLRLFDRTAAQHPGAEVVTGELTEPADLERALDGVGAVVHLAGNPAPTAAWEELRGPNVEGFAALLAAAARAGVRRVVFASSVHAMGAHETDGRVPVDAAWPPRPCCPYGATKAFDEAVAGVASRRGPVSTVGLRLGATVPEPQKRSQLASWLGPADLRRVVVRALEVDAARVRLGGYPAVSANTRRHWDLGPAHEDLGYAPELDPEGFADAVEDDGTDAVACPR
ncbi:NAD-dependent epimerase/dehydratase family protein [Kineococcus sp. SYSU DK005]|uniref:NAD-dependent epimerase/dehydratase family protein n=1 Tax=Kineococcus sp. SYSU DK005 TaxID=3383126 RepID=UPI003D7C3DD1